MFEEIELIGIAGSFVFGMLAAGSFGVLGYISKITEEGKTVAFNCTQFGITALVGGLAGVGLIAFDMSPDAFVALMTTVGLSVYGKKAVNIITALKDLLKK